MSRAVKDRVTKSKSQIKCFPILIIKLLLSTRYLLLATPMAWLGRISPEKGLEDAFAVTESTHISLKVMGKI